MQVLDWISAWQMLGVNYLIARKYDFQDVSVSVAFLAYAVWQV